MHKALMGKVKDGEFFCIDKPNPNLQSHLGQLATAVLRRHKDELWNLDIDYSLMYGKVFQPSNTYYEYLQLGQTNVTVYDNADEIPFHTRLGSLSRVNSETGSDPEIFVVNGKGDLMPAFTFLGKQSAVAASKSHGNNTAYAYRDGFAAEIYVAKGSCHGYLIDRLRRGMRDVLANAILKDETAKLTIDNTQIIPEKVMKEASADDLAFGCSPSLNAYDDAAMIPTDPRAFPMRFAGGHVHLNMVNWLNKNKGKAPAVVQGCDLMAALPGVAMFASYDTPARRQTYGRAGEYRLPQHGLEYRVLSNAWLASPEIAHLVLMLVRAGASIGGAGLANGILDAERMREIINFCDVDGARKFVTQNVEIYTKMIQQQGGGYGDKHTKAFLEVINEGIEAALPKPRDIASNWHFNTEWVEHSNNSRATWNALCLS